MLKQSVACSIFLSLSGNAPAQSLDQIYDAVRGDFNGDSYSDMAYLINNPDSEEHLELIIQLSTGEGHGVRSLAARSTNLVYKVEGSFHSVGEPSLSIRSFQDGTPDSLTIHSAHHGVGRSRWALDLSVAYREEKFIFAGLEYKAFDALGENAPISCSINALTGWVSNLGPQGIAMTKQKLQHRRVIGKDIENLDEEDIHNLIDAECRPD